MKLAEGIDLGRPSHKNHVQNGQVISFFTQNEDYFPFGPEGVFDTICCKNFSRKFKSFGEEWKEKVCHPPGDYYSHTKVTKIMLCILVCNSFRCSSFLVH